MLKTKQLERNSGAAIALAASLAAAVAAFSPTRAVAGVDVGVSIGISQPGVYGRIDIGRFPQPQVYVAQPVIVAQPRVVYARPPEPVYMWVPPGHRKNWHKHCHSYGACGAPVVFVRDEWYESHVRGGHDHPGKGHGKHKGKGRHDD